MRRPGKILATADILLWHCQDFAVAFGGGGVRSGQILRLWVCSFLHMYVKKTGEF